MTPLIRYRILNNNLLIGYAFILGHPDDTQEKLGTIIPMSRKGSWTAGNAEVILGHSYGRSFDIEKPDEEILKELAEATGIPWAEVNFSEIPLDEIPYTPAN